MLESNHTEVTSKINGNKVYTTLSWIKTLYRNYAKSSSIYKNTHGTSSCKYVRF